MGKGLALPLSPQAITESSSTMEEPGSFDSVATTPTAATANFGTVGNTEKSSGSSPDQQAVWELSKKVYDNICFLIFCPEHKRILLNESSASAVAASSGSSFKFFPYVLLSAAKKWHVAATEGAISILSDVRPDMARRMSTAASAGVVASKGREFLKFECIHIFRFQLPYSQAFLTRLIYLAVMPPSEAGSVGNQCCQNGAQCRWFSLADILTAKLPNIWGPEVAFYTHFLETSSNQGLTSIGITEYSMADAHKYHPSVGSEEQQPGSPEEAMLVGAGVSGADIERLYADFIEHSFPSFFMTRDSFELFMSKRHEIETELRKLKRYFNAFRTRGKPYLQFHELLLGLAAIDPRTAHGAVRVQLVFRYYDTDRDEYLNFHEFGRMLREVYRERQAQTPLDNQQITDEMTNMGMVVVNGQPMISMLAFKRAVGGHLFRGTSRLCRVTHSPFTIISQSLVNRKVAWGGLDKKRIQDVLRNRKYEGPCGGCRAAQPYELAWSVVYLDEKTGRFSRTERLGKSDASRPQVERSSHNRRENRKKSSISIHSKAETRYSLDITFNRSLVLHYLLDKIREFNQVKGTVRAYKGLMSAAKGEELANFVEDIRDITENIVEHLKGEQRCLRVNDPCYVIGDLHGNIEDLLTLEKTLWKRVPLLDANYLFLGDYVDRGRWGFEVFLYLMIVKLLTPSRVFLLRGNHEVRHIQIKYSFHKELIKKYGKDVGVQFFEMYNNVFDHLPCCAIINGSIFCCHGGIPYTQLDIQTLNAQTPKNVSQPELDAPALWEMLWSDPVESDRFTELADVLNLPENAYGGGFMPNMRRGTSVVFNEHAVELFFNINGLRFMIRAHEVPQNGYRFNFGTACTTIFSCSHYCGIENECAVALVDREGRMRIIRIDTTGNSSCTGDD